MPLQKQNLAFNFSQGLDTKNDPWQISPGKFLRLKNTVYNKLQRLTKRNGFSQLSDLPDTTSKFATTFNGNLTAIGTDLKAYINGSKTWISKSFIMPVDLDVLPLVKTNNNKSFGDSVVSSTNLVCTAYVDDTFSVSYKYIINDSVTGQNIIPATLIPNSGSITGSPRVFLLGNYFIIVSSVIVTGTDRLEYVAIKLNDPTVITSPVTITTQYTPDDAVAFDGYVANDTLFLAWNGSDVGGAIRAITLTSNLGLGTVKVFTGQSATMMSVTADTSGNLPKIYISFWDSVSMDGYTIVLNQILGVITTFTQIITSQVISTITSSAQNGGAIVIYEVVNAYSYDSGLPTDYIEYVTITEAGVVGSPFIVLRGVGLSSKSFIYNSIIYFLCSYGSIFQPTYFLIDSSGRIILKLAYENGGGYYTKGLPSAVISGSVVNIAYLFKDLVQSVNKNQNAPSVNGVYAQTGINLVKIDLNPVSIDTSELGQNLNISGGIMWAYDGVLPVEQGFNLWPDDIEITTSTSGGSISDQDYFYAVTYEWSDNQGNVFRSAPSIPIKVTTTGGNTSSNTIYVPTLRVTYKITNPVKIVIYRWSTAQQTYYQITSISSPLLNNTSIDSVQFVDTQADSSIVGNNILYTTGGVVENIAPTSVTAMALFKSRMFYIDAEDKNILGYSKQVIENTPVEFSDLFTIFVAPTTGAQGSTGPMTSISAMDDKLIIFKENSIYYLVGNGPDNTGANNDFSDPVFITSTVGCTNQQSIVFMPQGLMFQSDKGIWLLGRDLSTTYVGAPVEIYNEFTVVSSLNIPGTNQVRFTLNNGITLMYDYFSGQWGEFFGIPSISSVLYQDLHTYINEFGQVFQERPGSYLDGSNPVLIGFTTGWFNLAGLQGYERAYFVYLLAQYYSPHKLQVQIAYDYNDSPTQSTLITPTNFNGVYGSDPLYGDSTPYGGESLVEQWRIFLQTQKCESFQLIVDEFFDATFGTQAGAGLSISGINLVYGMKKSYTTTKANQNAG